MKIQFLSRINAFARGNYYLLSALLIFLSFPSYDIWILKGYSFFAWISLVPLLIFIRGKSWKEVYFYAFITGLIGNFLTYRWIGHFAGKTEGGYALIVSMLIPFITVFFAGRIFIAEMLSRRFERFRILIYPSAWIFIDWIISIGYLAFPWTYWGHSQYQFTPFIQLASITGILGINFFLILGNYLFSDIIREYFLNIPMAIKNFIKLPQSRRVFIFLSIFIFITISGKIVLVMNEREINRELRVSLIQSCISPWDNWNEKKFIYLGDLINYTDKSLKENPDLIVWSESATIETISYNNRYKLPSDFNDAILDYVKQSSRPLLTGEIGVHEARTGDTVGLYPQNNALLIDGSGKIVKTYAKINLVPFGEWFPYEKWFPSVKKIATKYGGSDFVPGNGPMLFNIKGRSFSALVCYEGIFFRLCREYKNIGADFFVNITNDGWTDTFNGHMQHFSASVFRAIENGLWYVRAGNTGYSVLIDPYGRVVRSMPILYKDYLIGDIDFSFNHDTFYSKFGDIILYVTIIFLGCLLIIIIYKNFNNYFKPVDINNQPGIE